SDGGCGSLVATLIGGAPRGWRRRRRSGTPTRRRRRGRWSGRYRSWLAVLSLVTGWWTTAAGRFSASRASDSRVGHRLDDVGDGQEHGAEVGVVASDALGQLGQGVGENALAVGLRAGFSERVHEPVDDVAVGRLGGVRNVGHSW